MALTSWEPGEPKEKAVLVFLRDRENLLLIHKKRGLGAGKVNAPGGRLEPGESWADAGFRETAEETGLTPRHLVPAADLRFRFTGGYSLWARVFLGEGWSGSLTPCEEADPFWHPASSLPWNQMWADDALWLPPVLGGWNCDGWFFFDGDQMYEAKITVHRWPSGPIGG